MIPRRLFIAADFVALYVAFAIAYIVWPETHRALSGVAVRYSVAGNFDSVSLPPLRELWWVYFVFAFASIFFLGVAEAYRPPLQQSRMRIVASVVFATICATGILTSALFALRRLDWSRTFTFSITVASAIALVAFRLTLRSYFRIRRDAGFYAKRVLLIGPAPLIEWLAEYFRDNISPAEYRIAGYLSLPDDGRVSAEFAALHLGQIHQLGHLLIREPINEVIAVQVGKGAEWMPDVIETCDSLGVLLRIIPEGLLSRKTKVLKTLYPFQLLHLPAVVLAPPHFDSDALFVKRAFDIVASAFLLVLLAPLFALIAIAIKITNPRAYILYRWNVVGRNGVRFTGYKFTTMYADADEKLPELLEKNEMAGPVFKIKNDPRVTPVGRFLRKYSLNELPQLWSVLKGDMSLVGPRPAFPHELEGYGFWHKRKLSIRPGITCLWQVRGRNKIADFDDWVKMDLEYIDNWSLWLDAKILLRTVWAVVAGTGS